jgi:shikimate kinase
MGAGKSTHADLLAERLGRAHRDSDRDIEVLTGRTGRVIAETSGVDELHVLEEAVLLGALAGDVPLVVSAAGSVIESERCRTALRRRATVVFLDVPIEELRERMTAGTHRRAMPRDELEDLAARRTPMFRELADIVTSATETPQRTVEQIVERLAANEARRRRP